MTASTLTMQKYEYSVRPYSSSDLGAVHRLAVAVTGPDAYQPFLLAQLADILGPGFLIARTGAGDDSCVAGFVVATPHAQDSQVGVVLTLVVDPAHPNARNALIDAAEDHLAVFEREQVVFAVTAAPPAALDAFDDRDDAPGLPAKYAVRPFARADLDDVYRVELSAFGDDPYPRPFFLGLADVLGTAFLVAERTVGDDRRVVGYLLAVSDSAESDRGWVMSLAVHPYHRGRHVGWQLMEETESYFKGLGRKEVLLTVDPDNEVAVDLYKHRHYDEIQRKDNLHGMKLSRLVMRRKLHLE